jgi:sterol desaturase/sphingolipid hydroxylase (fatty acid hydroxylase superfamily)
MKAILQYGAYPIVMLACMIGNVLLFREGAGFLVSTYVPVALGTLVIITLEARLPYRTAWRPSTEEVVQDSTFLALVHVVLPKMLSIAAAFVIFEVFDGRGWVTYSWWPKHWSLLSQTLLMVLLVDGMRYWLHRVSHEWELLWRFHAVHHSPHRLYTLNVGRFHPIDKSLQFVFEALPFICLGVKEDVLSLYFVWYAVNGFFQHSNVDVRLGVLNYFVSGPELHRWHHSMWKEESDHNYGNHLIVWDIVFGSRYLPPDRKVEALGLVNRRYPSGFMDQMTSPFIPGIDKRTA